MTSRVVTWHRDVDIESAPALGAEIDRALAEPGTDTTIVDLRGVEFMDSSGVGVLVRARNICRERGTALVLRGVSPAVRRLFTLTGLERFFELESMPLAPVVAERLPAVVPVPGAPDAKFDRIAALVARLLDVPIALVTMVDRNRQVVPGAAGSGAGSLTGRETPLAESYCQYVVAQAAPVIVDDVTREPLLAQVHAAAALDLTAYAGFPVTGGDGRAVGALCAADTTARQWTADEVQIMQDLASACSAELQLRAATRRVAQLTRRLRAERDLQRTVGRDIAALGRLLEQARANAEQPAAYYLDRSLAAVQAVDQKLRPPPDEVAPPQT